MFVKKEKGQTSIEILMILGVLVIGGIIFGVFYLSMINSRTADATTISDNDFTDYIDDNTQTTGTDINCGNGFIDGVEACDTLNFNGSTCSSLGFDSGTLSCNSNCTINTTNCVNSGGLPYCGDGIVNLLEQCDGSNNGTACSDLLPGSNGTVTCNIPGSLNECKYNTDNCVGNPTLPVCGDLIVNQASEDCDGSNNGATCDKFIDGSTGTVSCYAPGLATECKYNLSGCSIPPTPCGNSIIEPPENCDRSNLNGQTCVSLGLGFTGGILACDSSCNFSIAGCVRPPVCGNNRIEPPEQCDNSLLNGNTCTTLGLGFTGGTLRCYADETINECTYDTRGCTSNPVPVCGNSIIEPPEQCDGLFLNGQTCVTLGFTGGTLSCYNPFVRDACKFNTTLCDLNIPTTCPNGVCNAPGECTTCPADCSPGGILNPICVTAPDTIVMDIVPLSGSQIINTGFSEDVNTSQSTPSTLKYNLKVDITDLANTPIFNCRYNGGVRASSITIDTNKLPSFTTYTPFDCNTAGTYKLKFTATQDINSGNSAFKEAIWTIVPSGTVLTPIATPVAGTYNNTLSVTLSSGTSGAIIHYIVNGASPTCSTGTTGTGPIQITTTNTTIKAIACKSGMTDSNIMTATYALKVGTPVPNPVAGTYDLPRSVTLSTATTGAAIYYTTNGSTPTTTVSSTNFLYSSSILLTNSPTTIKAISTKSGFATSDVMSSVYTLRVATPYANLDSGTYNSTIVVTLATTTPGATIRYTLDGSTPYDGGSIPIYTSPITITTDRVLKAVAYKTGWAASYLREEDYIIDPCNVVSVDTYDLTGTTGECITPALVDYKFTTCENNILDLNTVTYNQVWYGSSPNYNAGYGLYSGYYGAPHTLDAELFCQAHGYTFVAGLSAPGYTGFTGIPVVGVSCTSGEGNGNQFARGGHSAHQEYVNIICASGTPKLALTATRGVGANSNYITFTSTPDSITCYMKSVGTNTTVDPVIWDSNSWMCGASAYSTPILLTGAAGTTTYFKVRRYLQSYSFTFPGGYGIIGDGVWNTLPAGGFKSDLLSVSYAKQ